MIRKGQARWVSDDDGRQQNRFITGCSIWLSELLGVGFFVRRKETHAAAEPISLAMVEWRAANNAAASRRPCWVSW